MKITRHITVQTSKENLWGWLTDFEKIKKWNPTLLEEDLVSTGEIKKGFKSRILLMDNGKKVWYENEISDYQPFHYLSTSLRGGNLGKSPMVIDYSIEELGSELKLHYESTWQPKGFLLKLMLPVIKIMANKNATACMQLLKKCAEG